jgi:SH3-like domain-containing protein
MSIKRSRTSHPKALFRNAAIALATLLALALPTESVAQAVKSATGLPLPRFVSLKSKKVNLRVGPGQDYAVSWMFMKPGLPVEIIQEYDNWRRIRYADGSDGWVYHSLLSGDRNAVAAPWMEGKGDSIFVNMRTEASSTANVVARLQPGVVFKIDQCTGDWCHANADGTEGWVSQAEIWGAYPGEAFTK